MTHPLIPSVFFGYALASVPALALDIQETEALKLYGGVYSTDCAKPEAPRAIVGETLKVEYGNKRMTGENLMAAASYFGPEPPPTHQMALLGEVRGSGGERMLFAVNRDKTGLYIEFMGDGQKVEKALKAVLGEVQFKSKYRDCDAASRTWMTTPPKAQPAAPASGSVANWDYVGDRKFKALHRKAIGAKAKTPWLAKLDGPSSGAKEVSLGGVTYWQLAVCKPHDCGDNNLVLLYARDNKAVYGLIQERGKQSLFGKPSPALAEELKRAWKSEWGQGQ